MARAPRCARLTVIVHVLFFLCCTLRPVPALVGGGPDTYVTELITRSVELQLAADPKWLNLVHYVPRYFGGVKSEADAPDFFLAPAGRLNPQAELSATLVALAQPADFPSRDGTHPQCVFRARYHWLRDRLAFDPHRIAEQACPKFDEWRAALNPSSITLVFPEAYMNNPASMFGHTLLRIDATEDGERRNLLAYATNFAAETGADGGATFAWKGMLGFYPGLFTIDPYYEKTVRYGDWEQRDIWEYELTFSAEEIDQLLEHLWEMRSVNFDYYFFDENCSYQILRLLEAARPSLRFRERLPPHVIPSDTVRLVMQEPGLVRRATFRASATTELRNEAAILNADELDLAVGLARGDRVLEDPVLLGLDDARRATVLTVSHDYLRHSFLASQVGRVPAAERARRILIERSKIAVSGSAAPPIAPPGIRPDQGHETARFSVGGGWREKRPFVQLGIRPSFHDLLDPSGGYTRGAQIDFLNASIRIYPDRGEVRLQDLAIVDIVSIAPRDALFRSISWRINTRIGSQLVESDHRGSGVDGLEDRYLWRTNGGPGVAFEPLPEAVLYSFLEATADIGRGLRNSHALGVGAEIGAFWSLFSDRWKMQGLAEITEFALGGTRTQYRFGTAQRISLSPTFALRFDLTHTHDFDRDWLEGVAAAHWYF